MDYNCECCKYITKKRFNYDKHVLSNKHKLISGLTPTAIATKSAKMECNYCKQEYKNKIALGQHTNQCKMINELTELVRTMNDRLDEQQKQMNEQKIKIEHIISEIF